MKTFRFRFGKLLKLRREEERQALFDLQSLRRKEHEILSDLKKLGEERGLWTRAYNEAGQKKDAAEELLLIEHYFADLDARHRRLDREILSLQNRLNEAVKNVEKAHRAFKEVEYLREIEWEDYRQKSVQEERRAVDEINVLRRGRADRVKGGFAKNLVLALAVLFSASASAAGAEPPAKGVKSLEQEVREFGNRSNAEWALHDKDLTINLQREIDRAAREREKAASLKILEEELARREEELKKLQEGLSQKIQKKAEENENLRLLVSLYESIGADRTAALLKKMPLSVSVAVIRMMAPKKSGKVLAAMEPKFAALISRELIRSNPATALKSKELEIESTQESAQETTSEVSP